MNINNNQKGFIAQGIVAVVALVLIASGAYYVTKNKNVSPVDIEHPELVSKYQVLKDNDYIKLGAVTELHVSVPATLPCDSAKVINYRDKTNVNPKAVGGDWVKIDVIDCGNSYWISNESDSGSKLYGPFNLSNTSSTTSTSDWNKYSSPYLGFEVYYPTKLSSGIGYINNEEWLYVEGGDKGVVFGTPSSQSGGFIWNISVRPKSGFDREKYIKAIGEQFSDRKESRQNVTINGIPALLVTVTTDKNKSWISKIIYLEKNNVIYMIGNGAVDIPEFTKFYNSFRFTN